VAVVVVSLDEFVGGSNSDDTEALSKPFCVLEMSDGFAIDAGIDTLAVPINRWSTTTRFLACLYTLFCAEGFFLSGVCIRAVFMACGTVINPSEAATI